MAPTAKAKPATGPSAGDIATNQALLKHAEATKIAKSWLSSFTSTEGRNDTAADKEEEEELEKELLKNKDVYSDTGGIGYHAPDSSSFTSTSRPATTDQTTTFLRKQLLKGRGARATNGVVQNHSATTARPHPQHTQRNAGNWEDSEEEESRAGVGKHKSRSKSRAVTTVPRGAAQEDTVPPATDGAEPRQPSSMSRKQPKATKKRGASSYLDELLASRAAKQQKKNEAKMNPG